MHRSRGSATDGDDARPAEGVAAFRAKRARNFEELEPLHSRKLPNEGP